MAKAKRRSYSPEEFREVLGLLYGPASDWKLAEQAEPDFNVGQRTILRYLKGPQRVTGAAAGLTYQLARGKRHDQGL